MRAGHRHRHCQSVAASCRLSPVSWTLIPDPMSQTPAHAVPQAVPRPLTRELLESRRRPDNSDTSLFCRPLRPVCGRAVRIRRKRIQSSRKRPAMPQAAQGRGLSAGEVRARLVPAPFPLRAMRESAPPPGTADTSPFSPPWNRESAQAAGTTDRRIQSASEINSKNQRTKEPKNQRTAG